jgi:hypothetical protein
MGWSRIANRFCSARRQINSNMSTWAGARAHLPIAQPLVKPPIPVTLKDFEETAGPSMLELAPNGRALRRFHRQLQ